MAKVVTIGLTVDGKDAKRVLSQIRKDFKGVDASVETSSKKFSKMGAAIGAAVAAVGIREVAQLSKKIFELGSAVEETESKFVTSLGNQAEAGRAFLDEYSTLLGLSNTEAKNFLATQVNIAKGLGFTEDEAFNLSKEVVKLAGDLSSFNNIPIERTLNAIQGGLTGEREALKSLGIVVRQQDVDQRALLNTGKERVQQLTEQEKSLASFQIITERSGVAVGDLKRTQDSAANQARQLQASIKDLADELSVALLPALAKGVEFSLKLLEGFNRLILDFPELRAEIQQNTTSVETFVGSIQDLREELAKETGTAENQSILADAYNKTNDALVKQASALFDKNYELIRERDAITEIQAKTQFYQEKLARLNLQIKANEQNLRLYTQAITEGQIPLSDYTTATEEQATATDTVTKSFENFKPIAEEAKDVILEINEEIIDTGMQFMRIDEIINSVDFDFSDKIEASTEALDKQQALLGELESAFGAYGDTAKSAALGAARALLTQAIATQIAKILAAVPFPFNLIAAAGAGGAVNQLFDSIPGFADGVTGFGGGTALVGERGPELVTLPQGSNVITNENTDSILSAMARKSTTSSVDNIGSNSSDIVGAIKEAFKDIEIPIKGEISNDVIRLSNKKALENLKRNTVTI